MPDIRGAFDFVGKLWDQVSAFFVAMWEYVWAGFSEALPDFLETIFTKIGFTTKAFDDVLWDKFLEYAKHTGIMNDSQIEFYQQYKALPALPSLFMLGWIGSTTITMSLAMFLKGNMQVITQDLNAEQRPELPDVGSLLQSAFVAPEKTGEIREQLAKHGFSEKAIDTLFLARYRLYDVDVCRDLFLRGEFTSDQLFMRMRELGFTDTRTKEIMATWQAIPGPGDLFHLVGKEAFEPDMIKLMGLLDEFPNEQVKWLEAQGISKFWAEKYWAAHWEQPSLQMGFQMLHRGVIDMKELDMLFKTVEIPPFWRDKLTDIAYSPYTRVDVRRMFDFDVIDVNDVFTAYSDQGYDYEHAINLTKWTVAQKEGQNKDISAGQILSVFEGRMLERDEAKSLLGKLGYSEEKAEFLLISKEYDIEEKYQKKRLKLIEERFVNRYIDKFEALRQLGRLNLPYKQTNLLMEEWELDLLQDKKLPSKTDLEKFFLADIIDSERYYVEMEKLAYNRKYIDWYHQILVKKKGAE